MEEAVIMRCGRTLNLHFHFHFFSLLFLFFSFLFSFFVVSCMPIRVSSLFLYSDF